MTDAQLLKRIKVMSPAELLDLVMSTPEYLTDGYYSKFHVAIHARYKELTK
jgi:hypothetical protein